VGGSGGPCIKARGVRSVLIELVGNFKKMTNKQANKNLSFILIFLILCLIVTHRIGYKSGYKAKGRENDHWECEYTFENVDEISVKCLRVMGVGSNLPDIK